ncbi:hypothetical protein Tco_0561084 [Tanacetum coccineum]
MLGFLRGSGQKRARGNKKQLMKTVPHVSIVHSFNSEEFDESNSDCRGPAEWSDNMPSAAHWRLLALHCDCNFEVFKKVTPRVIDVKNWRVQVMVQQVQNWMHVHNNEDLPSTSSIIVEEHTVPPIVTTSEEQTSPILMNEAADINQEDYVEFDGNTLLTPYDASNFDEAESSTTTLDQSNIHEFH